MKSVYLDGSKTLGFAFSVVMVSLVAMMSLATNGEFGRKRLQSPRRILLIW